MTAEGSTVVTIRDLPDLHRYEADVDGAAAGLLDYRRGAGRILLRHTEVDPAFEGRGIGARLAEHAIVDARAVGLTIIVTCPYIRAWLARHPEHAEGVILR
jgi:uncharacterized protein